MPWTLRGEMKKQEELFVSLLNNSTECSLTTSFSKCDTSWRAALDEEMYANFQSGQYYTQFNTTSQQAPMFIFRYVSQMLLVEILEESKYVTERS